jgi:hypothetical protein
MNHMDGFRIRKAVDSEENCSSTNRYRTKALTWQSSFFQRRCNLTDCQKFCPIHSSWGSGNSSSLRATQSHRIFVQRIPATFFTHEPFDQDFWQRP